MQRSNPGKSAAPLAGRVALVTGASAGLGFAAARALARQGARVALVSRGGEKLEAAGRSLRSEGAEVMVAAADVSSAEALAAAVGAVEEGYGAIDILVANGGGPTAKPALELTEEDWQRALPLAFLFVPRLCSLVLPGMRSRRFGRIVAINSVSARQPIPGLALSNSLRPAVLGYLKTLSQEVAAEGITVNAVLPGYTLTERQEELATDRGRRSGLAKDEVISSWAQQIPLGRMAQADEIAAMIAFLATPEAAYVTGQAITVDGGYVRGLL